MQCMVTKSSLPLYITRFLCYQTPTEQGGLSSKKLTGEFHDS